VDVADLLQTSRINSRASRKAKAKAKVTANNVIKAPVSLMGKGKARVRDKAGMPADAVSARSARADTSPADVPPENPSAVCTRRQWIIAIALFSRSTTAIRIRSTAAAGSHSLRRTRSRR